MKRLSVIAVLLLCSWSAHSLAASGNINVLLGGKHMSSGDWAPYDEQGELGVLFDIRGENWPISIAVDLLVSAHNETSDITYTNPWGWTNVSFDGTVSTSELDLGVRKVFELPGIDLHPYVGGGFGVISAAYDEDVTYTYYDTTYGYGSYTYSDSESDSSLGYWLNAGIYWSIGGHFNLGVDARYSKADVTIYNKDVSAGGSHLAVVAGYHW